jgi:trans-aconitate 2-methyltransferase
VPSWDPARYLLFGDLRTRPAHELLARIPLESPAVVMDVGCGPGNSTNLLVDRWPHADVVGIDSSPEMVDRARNSVPRATFIEADLRFWKPPRGVDLVFSNATLHWVADHPDLFERLVSWLSPGGVLAIQMPANFDQPSHVLMRRLASSEPWRNLVGGVLRTSPVASPADYYRLLASPGRTVDVWTTEYLHVLTGNDPVVQWVMGSWLRPLLDLLDETQSAEFVSAYTKAVRDAYPPEPDGTTLFPFRRLFIVCQT